MISYTVELELRAIASLSRGLARGYGRQRTAQVLTLLADRIEAVTDEYGEMAWRRRVEEQCSPRAAGAPRAEAGASA